MRRPMGHFTRPWWPTWPHQTAAGIRWRNSRKEGSGIRAGEFPARFMFSSCTRRDQMLKNTRLQMIAMLAIGGLFGYAAASGKLDVFRKANAGPPQPSVADKERSSAQATTAPCCVEGAPKAQLVAMADPKVTNTAAKFHAEGTKPNILFIMGDDIG